MSLDLRPASTLSLADMAALFNRAYEGYVVPFHVDERIVRFMYDWYDIDREASRLAYVDGEPVGLGNVAIRGEEAWIGGVGVVPSARRSGIGEALMNALHDEARRRGVCKVWLEVIDRNEGAFLLYEKLGYDVVREVEVWSLDAGEETGAGDVAAEEAAERIRTMRRDREPWQRADATLEHMDDLFGVATERAAALFRVSNVVQLMQIAGDDAHELLRMLRGRGKVAVINLPAQDPAAEAFRELGGSVSVRQHEMALDLSGQG